MFFCLEDIAILLIRTKIRNKNYLTGYHCNVRIYRCEKIYNGRDMEKVNKIVPHLWFDKEAKEAADFYTKIFDNSKVRSSAIVPGTPSGDAEIIDFEIMGMRFQAISAGPYFKTNPSISFMVSLGTKEEVDSIWASLAEGGEIFMPLSEYPFSKWYGWVKDRYGVTWQLILVEGETPGQSIKPCLLFSEKACGLAGEAVGFYTDVFRDSSIGIISKYGEGEALAKDAKVNFAAFKLEGVEFVAMDNAMEADFTFNEALSLIVMCKDQNEIDYYWEKLSAVAEAEQCGWIKDKYGLSWQIIPESMDEVFYMGSNDEVARVTESFLKMKKIDLAELERARQGI
jgi:predicted 3-demethylubiquinone-9 3-methyltransferase (glyoxalase superfamily)